MGNATTVAKAVKNQGDADIKTLYKLVDLKGGGELVELMKNAKKTKDFTELDERIKRDVKEYLYNNGDGRQVPIIELIQFRNEDRGKGGIRPSKRSKKFKDEEEQIDGIVTNTGATIVPRHENKTRFQCWALEKRGTVGETILHLCFLNATQIHFDLSKRVLKYFPNLINDIYAGEEYYGEAILHLAIVNEDPAMVKYLLDSGADFEIPATGKFFTPDDQKESRVDCEDHEWVDLCVETNYEGYVYWGEYPLGFAACLNQEECVRLLLAKGANPNMQDTNGNTVMHLLIILDNKDQERTNELMDMFDLLHSQGARLDIKNRQGLTPMTLAAKLARKDMFEHIAEILREVYWLYGNVTSAGYPLTDIDTISDTGEINTKSALNLIVYGEAEGHLDMMDGVIVKLLQEKWKTFARFRFYRRFIFFILYFLVFIVSFNLRPGTDLCAYLNDTSSLHGCGQTGLNRTADPCYLLKTYRNEDVARMVLEVITLTGAVGYLLLAMKEVYHQGFSIFFKTLTAAPAKALFLMSVFFVLLMLPGRAACAHQFEDIVGVLAVLTTAPYFLFFCRGFSIVGPSVVMIYNMIRGDLLRFVIIYIVFLIGFSQAMYIVFEGVEGTSFEKPEESIMAMFIMSLGQFGDFYDSFDSTKFPALGKFEAIVGMFSMSVGDYEDLYGYFEELSAPFNGLIKAMFIVYMIMVTLLLVNMLIAMMGRTYEMVSNTEKEWFRQWANIVLVVEQTLSTEHRKDQMYAYSVAFGERQTQRALMIRWHQTEKEKEELKNLRIKNKITQRQLAQQKEGRVYIRKSTVDVIDFALAEEGRLNI